MLQVTALPPAMETPSSMRRVTRSQTASAAQKSEQEEHLSSRSKAKGKPERSPLLDVTNDSPIVGLATEKTPASSVAKSSVRVRWTPGSGEALLRGQVKTLLQKVEEEEAAELGGEILLSGRHRPPFLAPLGFLKSPLQLLAPTPANTPQIPNAAGIAEECAPMGVMVVVASAVQEQHSKILPQVVEALKHDDEPVDDSGCLITRALLFDSPEKSEASDTTTVSSSLTYQGSESCHTLNSTEDDNSATWSIQVNASTQEDDDEDIQGFEVEELYFNEEEQEEQGEEDDDDEQSFADLCEGLRRMTVVEENDKKRLPEFAGKHTRFIYNSDDEMEGKEVFCENRSVSPSVLVLKGLPVPEGKHLRFQDEEEEN